MTDLAAIRRKAALAANTRLSIALARRATQQALASLSNATQARGGFPAAPSPEGAR